MSNKKRASKRIVGSTKPHGVYSLLALFSCTGDVCICFTGWGDYRQWEEWLRCKYWWVYTGLRAIGMTEAAGKADIQTKEKVLRNKQEGDKSLHYPCSNRGPRAGFLSTAPGIMCTICKEKRLDGNHTPMQHEQRGQLLQRRTAGKMLSKNWGQAYQCLVSELMAAAFVAVLWGIAQ